ncbi:MAG: DNA translocase FtsK [Chloroflexota bacterium]
MSSEKSPEGTGARPDTKSPEKRNPRAGDTGKSSSGAAPRAQKPATAAEKQEGDARARNLRTVQPEFWDDLLDALPPWFDEITSIVLLVFGVISLMALFGVAGDAVLARSWSNALTSLFGWGSVLVAVGIVASGVLILLPKIGVTINISARQALALEVAFLALLALLHVGAGDPELRALARAGQGGGYIGWGMCVLPYAVFGDVVTMILFGAVLVFSLGVAVGIRHEQVSGVLRRVSDTLSNQGQKLAATPLPERRQKSSLTPAARPGLAEAEKPVHQRVQVMRIRPDRNRLPPSLRPAATPPPEPADKQKPAAPVERDADYERLSQVLKTSAETIAAPRQFKLDVQDIIGELLPKKKTDPQMVRRPDGRVKHYFTTEAMAEPKKIIKREKDLPPLELLQDVEIAPPDEEEINTNVVLIENTLLEFDINVDVVDVKTGPTVTQYAVQPFREVKGPDGEIVKERTRLSKIAALANDLALSLSVKRLRLETPVPGHSYMGVEVPNRNPSTVALRSVYESKAFHDAWLKAKSPLVVPLGRDVAGQPVIVDLATMPHLLIAGTTGSGKSVAIAAMATALILNNMPDIVKLIMLDPKMVELARFNGLPHLLGPVETDMERIIGVLRWCTREMDRRYKLLEENAARNIEIYNSRLGQRRKAEHLPYIVIMVDEIGDLMMNRPEETERAVTRLAQMARAVGMHLVVATQRPSVDVITGLIKANFPARISFAVASGIDSRVILDTGGAETLLGKGDMLYLAQDAAGPRRLQGCYLSDTEVRAIVRHWADWLEKVKKAGKADQYVTTAPWERGLTRREFLAETDPMLEDAIELVVEEQEASASQIQRKLGLGYPRAARIIDLLEELGVIGEQVAGGRTRKVLIEKGKDPFKEIIDKRTREQRRDRE